MLVAEELPNDDVAVRAHEAQVAPVGLVLQPVVAAAGRVALKVAGRGVAEQKDLKHGNIRLH